MNRLQQEARVIERFRLIELAQKEGISEAARQFEYSRTTVYKLLARYQEKGLQGLMNRPRGPRKPLAAEQVEMMVELKSQAPHRSTNKIR